MTYEELLQLAYRKKFVRWDYSGAYEMVRVGRRGDIMAEGVTTRLHPIRRQKAYNCIEVLNEMVPIGLLFVTDRIPFALLRPEFRR